VTRAAVIVAAVSALCLGVSLGFMGGVMFSRHMLLGGRPEGMGFGRHPWRMFHHGAAGGPGTPSPRMLVPRLQRLLDLTPEQTDAIRAEIERSRGDFAQVRDSLHARIERHLTAPQRDRWRSMSRERNPGGPGGLDPRNLRAVPGRDGERSR
jgi:hypothetical protein